MWVQKSCVRCVQSVLTWGGGESTQGLCKGTSPVCSEVFMPWGCNGSWGSCGSLRVLGCEAASGGGAPVSFEEGGAQSGGSEAREELSLLQELGLHSTLVSVHPGGPEAAASGSIRVTCLSTAAGLTASPPGMQTEAGRASTL